MTEGKYARESDLERAHMLASLTMIAQIVVNAMTIMICV